MKQLSIEPISGVNPLENSLRSQSLLPHRIVNREAPVGLSAQTLTVIYYLDPWRWPQKRAEVNRIIPSVINVTSRNVARAVRHNDG